MNDPENNAPDGNIPDTASPPGPGPSASTGAPPPPPAPGGSQPYTSTQTRSAAPPRPQARRAPIRGYMLLAYILFLLGMSTGVVVLSVKYMGLLYDAFSLVAILILNSQRRHFEGTIYESHVTWLNRTFFLTLGFILIGVVFMPFVGNSDTARQAVSMLLMATTFYYVYRTGKGLLRFSRAEPIKDPLGFF